MSKESESFTDGLNVCNPERLNNGCMIYRVSEEALAEALAKAEENEPDDPGGSPT
jgi:hypothetical protein